VMGSCHQASPAFLAGDIATDTESESEKWRLHREVLDARQPFRDFVYTVNGTGSPVYVRTSGKPIHDANGNFLGYPGTGTNITAKIRADRAEHALRKAQAELAHATRVTTLGEMTASIAHEVKQPVGATVTNAQAASRLLGTEVIDTNELREILRDIDKDGNRAGEVISRISDLIRKAPPRRDDLEINGAIREVIEFTRGATARNRVSVRTELADRLPLVRGDRVELQQVILNVVMNGIEAMRSIEHRPRALVIRSVQDETQQVRVSVTDCGVGMSAENADRRFDAFFTTKSSGMGMGLSICRSIMEAHGGRLWATANVRHGATFHLTLPLNADTAS
jgi:C4-dicarboxylate-specific signal transduction histidine kinase